MACALPVYFLYTSCILPAILNVHCLFTNCVMPESACLLHVILPDALAVDCLPSSCVLPDGLAVYCLPIACALCAMCLCRGSWECNKCLGCSQVSFRCPSTRGSSMNLTSKFRSLSEAPESKPTRRCRSCAHTNTHCNTLGNSFY